MVIAFFGILFSLKLKFWEFLACAGLIHVVIPDPAFLPGGIWNHTLPNGLRQYRLFEIFTKIKFQALEKLHVYGWNMETHGELGLHKLFRILLNLFVVWCHTKTLVVQILACRDHWHRVRFFVTELFRVFWSLDCWNVVFYYMLIQVYWWRTLNILSTNSEKCLSTWLFIFFNVFELIKETFG